MSIKTFWTILIKILGLFLISATLVVLPQSFSSVYFAIQSLDIIDKIVYPLLIIVLLFIYFLIIRLFIYKTSWIIEKLKLEKGFDNQNIELNFDANKIISLAIIVIGGIIFIDSFPLLLREIMVFFQNESLFKDYPKSGWIIFYFVKVIIGYLLMTNSFKIAKIIQKQNKE
jgi:signal transduction histidine kinase